MDNNGIFHIFVPKGSGTYTITAQCLLESKTRTVKLDGKNLNYWGCDFSFELPGFDPVPSPSPSATAGKTSQTVTFNANGGTVSKKSLTIKVGAAVGSLPKPTRKGYVFAGWFTAKSGGSKVSATTKISKNVTLYAHWAKPKYKVAFYANGGTGKMSVQTFKYGKAKKLSANKFKRYFFTFKGWAKSKALAKKGKVAYKNKKKVKNLIITGKTVKLYAVWKKK